MVALRDRITCPYTGKRGKVVFISPVNRRVYVEYDRCLPFVTYAAGELATVRGDTGGANLFGPLG